jgi:hypothetical protein
VKYQPDRYVNKITTRRDNYALTVPFPTERGPLFDTWEAAQEWLIIDRAQKARAAYKNWRNAERQLENANQMKKPVDESK